MRRIILQCLLMLFSLQIGLAHAATTSAQISKQYVKCFQEGNFQVIVEKLKKIDLNQIDLHNDFMTTTQKSYWEIWGSSSNHYGAYLEYEPCKNLILGATLVFDDAYRDVPKYIESLKKIISNYLDVMGIEEDKKVILLQLFNKAHIKDRSEQDLFHSAVRLSDGLVMLDVLSYQNHEVTDMTIILRRTFK